MVLAVDLSSIRDGYLFLEVINDYVKENNLGHIIISKKKEIEDNSKTDYHLGLEKIKEDFPNAYAPWSTEEDYLLETLYSKNRSVDEIARILKRQPSAIRARLGKFEDVWKNSKTL